LAGGPVVGGLTSAEDAVLAFGQAVEVHVAIMPKSERRQFRPVDNTSSRRVIRPGGWKNL
jgi:hypothetical protein